MSCRCRELFKSEQAKEIDKTEHLPIATALAQKGASVIVTGRSQERVWAAIDQIKASTPNLSSCMT